MPVSPRHLVFTVLLLVTLVGVHTLLDARRTQRELEREVRERSTALLWTLLTSSRNAAAGSLLFEEQIAQRLFDNARLVDRLLAGGGLRASQLEEIAVQNHLQRIELLDRTGRRLPGTPQHGPRDRQAVAPDGTRGMKTAQQIERPRPRREAGHPAGPGIKETPPRDADDFRVSIPATSFPGSIAIRADGKALLRFQERMSIQRLLEELGERADVAYAALLDAAGQVLAHSDPRRVGSREARIPEAGAREWGTPRRVVRSDVGEVYETAAPFPLGRDRDGELRLGLSSGTVEILRAQEHRNAGLYAGTILLVGVLGVLAIFLNQRHHLRSVQAFQDKAQQDQRLAALGNLAAGVAHEIRNPLNALAMGLQRLVREWRVAPDEDHAEFARLGQVLQGEVARLNEIVERFLQLARPAHLTLAPCRVAQVLEGLLALAREEATAKGIALEAELALDGIVAHLDGGQLHQAFLNIVRNAIQAMPEGGKLRITARARDRQLEMAVADTGSGIPPEHLHRIFEPYFTTKAGGTGLGLAIAQRIIEAHGGSIRVDSRAETGSTFRIRLPLTGPPEAPHA